jgi:transposase
MQGKTTSGEYTGQHVYVGIDVGAKSWKVCIELSDNQQKTFSQPPTPQALITYLQTEYPGATYHSAYEAGYFGFWIHRQLTEANIECIVVNPADIPTSNRDRVYKTDENDCRKIARELHGNRLRAIWIPSEQAINDRTLLRARRTIVKEQTRIKNRIKALLRLHGIDFTKVDAKSYWSQKFIRWLEQVEFSHASGRQTMGLYLQMLASLRQTLLVANRAIRQLSQTDRYRDDVALLVSVPGISKLGAMILLVELIEISRFKNLDHLAGYIGLIPGTNSSGERERTTGITPRSNGMVRTLLIESAWIAVRNDAQLGQRFTALSQRMPKNRAIVVIARKLLGRIHSVLKSRQPYRLTVPTVAD